MLRPGLALPREVPLKNWVGPLKTYPALPNLKGKATPGEIFGEIHFAPVTYPWKAPRLPLPGKNGSFGLSLPGNPRAKLLTHPPWLNPVGFYLYGLSPKPNQRIYRRARNSKRIPPKERIPV